MAKRNAQTAFYATTECAKSWVTVPVSHLFLNPVPLIPTNGDQIHGSELGSMKRNTTGVASVH